MQDDDQLEDEENRGFEEPEASSVEQENDNHEIPDVPEVGDSYHKDQFHDPIASPSVTGEEDVFSGDAPEGEPADIDDELKKVGLENDEEGVKPLSSDDIDY